MRTYQMEQRGGDAKYYYLYRKMKEDILSGMLKKGEKLPSKRTLAEHLGISLITVENAYQMLKEEGYIKTRERSGYYVCELPVARQQNTKARTLTLLPEPRYYESGFSEKADEKSGQLFPSSVYFKTVRSVLSEYPMEILEKSPNEGCAVLRNSIAEYLLRYRGIYAQPNRIIIGSGAENLYGSVVRLLGNDKVYGLEDPSYEQIRKVYEGAGASCEMLAMGSDGIRLELLKERTADVLHVTPFHSFPSGVTASVKKRYEYLDWAAQKEGRYIVEDDFDSEFFMPGKPIETLFMLDDLDRVIYINTFSKSLSPSIRMGYMILPEELLERYKQQLGDFSCTVPVLDQYVLAKFIDEGHFEQHLNRVRRQNRER